LVLGICIYLGGSINFEKITKPVVDRVTGEGIWKYSTTLLLMQVMSIILKRVDILMIGFFMISESVGLYKVAVVITSPLLIFLTSTNSIFPSMVSSLDSKKGKGSVISELYMSSTRWIASLTIPAAVIVCVFSPQILSIFGPEYRTAATPVVILALGNIFKAVVGCNGYLLSMTSHHRLEFINLSVLCGLNALLNGVLIPIYGIVGAAIATATSISLINLVKILEVKKLLGMFPYDKESHGVVIVFILTIAISLLVKYIVSGMVGAAIALIMTYLVTFTAINRYFPKRDIEAIKNYLPKV
jgi:O-antigen/teichoic acid export membrane protein